MGWICKKCGSENGFERPYCLACLNRAGRLYRFTERFRSAYELHTDYCPSLSQKKVPAFYAQFQRRLRAAHVVLKVTLTLAIALTVAGCIFLCTGGGGGASGGGLPEKGEWLAGRADVLAAAGARNASGRYQTIAEGSSLKRTVNTLHQDPLNGMIGTLSGRFTVSDGVSGRYRALADGFGQAGVPVAINPGLAGGLLDMLDGYNRNAAEFQTALLPIEAGEQSAQKLGTVVSALQDVAADQLLAAGAFGERLAAASGESRVAPIASGILTQNALSARAFADISVMNAGELSRRGPRIDFTAAGETLASQSRAAYQNVRRRFQTLYDRMVPNY